MIGLGVVLMGLWSFLGCGGADLPGKARGTTTALPHPSLVFAASGKWMVYDPATKKVTTWEPSPVTTAAEVAGDGVFTVGRERLSPAGVVFRGAAPSGAFGAALSPDGGHLAYVKSNVVEILNIETGAVTALGQGGGPTWSPTDPVLAFASGPRDANRVVAVAATDGTVPRVVASGRGSVVHLAWSPDGTQIAFTTQRYQDRIWSGSLYGVVAAGGEAMELATLQPRDWAQSPAWSPDGSQLAFTLKPMSDNPAAIRGAALAVVPATGGGAPRVVVPVTHYSPSFTSNKAHNGVSNPAWSPDGAELAFTASFEGDCSAGNAGLKCTTDVYVVDAAGGDRVRLTQLGLTAATEVRWVP